MSRYYRISHWSFELYYRPIFRSAGSLGMRVREKVREISLGGASLRYPFGCLNAQIFGTANSPKLLVGVQIVFMLPGVGVD